MTAGLNTPSSASNHLSPYKWLPGQSGNPNGRAKDKVGALIRAYDEARDFPAARAIIDIGMDTKEKTRDRLNALIWWEEKGWGKPKLEIEIEHFQPSPGIFKGRSISTLRALMTIAEKIQNPAELDRLIALAAAPAIESQATVIDDAPQAEESRPA